MFCLLVVLAKLSVLAKWLVRKTPLRKPNHGEGIFSIKPRAEEIVLWLWLCWFIVFFYCFIAWYLCSPRPYVIYFLLLWHDIAYLCWKCRKTPTDWLTSCHPTNSVRALEGRCWITCSDCRHTPAPLMLPSSVYFTVEISDTIIVSALRSSCVY